MNIDNHKSPFVGLRPFESDESLLFFGRQEQTMELLQRLHQHHFVAIIGNSGCGKSSLIRGGLIPRLKAGYLVDDHDRWMIAIMKPGQRPLYNLAAVILKNLGEDDSESSITGLVKKIQEEGSDALLSILHPLWEKQDTNLFLLVDQFEELFRFSMDQKEVQKKDEAIDFVNIMLELARRTDLPIYVVLTMRSDFIGDCAQFFGLPEAMNQSQYLVPRLNRMQLKNAIEGPIRLYGAKISPSLISRLLNDAAVIKDELPLLQHALMRTWDCKIDLDKNDELGLADYLGIGGIEKALSNHADEALRGMSESELELTKQIFQALIVTDEGGRKIRRPVLMSELSEITRKGREQLMDIISRFSEEKKSFLIVSKPPHSNDELIDISHESLIRQWSALNQWAEEEYESSKIYLQVNESATLHKDKKKDLLKGREFQITMQWYESFNPSATWAKRYNDGFDMSIDYLLKSAKEVKLTERRKRNRLVLTFSAIIVSLCAVFFIIKSRTDAQKRVAVNLKDAFALNSTANNLEPDDPTIAIRLAEAGYEKVPDLSFIETMQKIYLQNAFYRTIARDSSEIPFLTVAADGKSFLTGSYGRTAKLWDIDGKLLTQFKGHKDSVVSIVFSRDGKKVLTASRDSTAKIWDLNGNVLLDIKDRGGKLLQAIFSPDGGILTAAWDSTAKLYDSTGHLLKTFVGHGEKIRAMAFSPDGKTVLTGAQDNIAILWDLNARPLQMFRGHKGYIAALAFSPDGTRIATSSFDETIRLWDLQGNELKEFVGHNWPVYAVSFSRDGKKILSCAFDNTARLWDLEGNVIQEFKGHADRVRAAAFLPDDSRIITTGSDKTIRLWYRVNNLFREFRGFKDSVNTAIFSPDGNKIFIASTDKTAKLCHPDGRVISEFKPHADRIHAAHFLPDGNRILIAFGKAFELRTSDDRLLMQYAGHNARITSLAVSNDGTKILTGSIDSTVKLWDINGTLLGNFHINEVVVAVTFSTNGSNILAMSDHFVVTSRSLAGVLLKRIKLKETDSIFSASYSSVAFSPDGSQVLISNRDTIARLWSLDRNGMLLAHYSGHTKPVLAVAFSPDGKRILTGSEDYKVRLFDITGRPLLELKGHNECVVTVAFSPDGSRMLTGSEDYTARLWNNMPLQDFLKSDLVDELGNEQRKKYNITR